MSSGSTGEGLVSLILDVGDRLREVQRAGRMKSWPRVAAEIIHSEVRFTLGGMNDLRGRRTDAWAVNIVVRYDYGGVREVSVRPVVDEPPMYLQKEEAESVARDFPIGARRDVWVDPKHPDKAVFNLLDPSDAIGKLAIAFFLMISAFALFGWLSWRWMGMGG